MSESDGMEQMTAAFAEFSHFTIQETARESDHTLLVGRLTKPGRLSYGQRVSLFISLDDDVPGKLTELDPDAATASLAVVTAHLHPTVVIGATFPLYDNNWNGCLHLALDDAIQWNRVQFAAIDAFEEPSGTPGWYKSRIATPDDRERTDGRIVPAGWDHEHCEICWQKIGSGGDPEGYVSTSDQWVCVRCHTRYVSKRNLGFALGATGDEADDVASQTGFQQIGRLIDDYDLAGIRRFLVESGNIDSRSKYGWTPLMVAASHGHQSLISLLIDSGADVNAVAQQHGYTALALAAQKGFVRAVERLLEAGATVEVPDTFCGGSLLTYVKTGPGRENARISELLTRAGAK